MTLAALSLAPVARAQKGSSSGNAGRSTNTNNFPTSPTPSINSRAPDVSRTIFLSGKVVMQEGGPPSEPVAIERVCGGVAHREGFTDSKGHFSLTLGDRQPTVLPDASEATGTTSTMATLGMPTGAISERQLWNCELVAVSAGFTSSRVNLAGRHVMDNPDVGTIVLSHLSNVSGTTVSVISLAAPPNAKKEYEKAREAKAKKKLEDAQKHVSKAIEIYPKFASAYELLGEIQQEQNQPAEARKSYDQAVAADSSYLTPYLHLALLSANEKNWPEVVKFTDSALRLDPVDLPFPYFYRAVAEFNLNQMGEAEKSALKAEDIDKLHQFPRVELLVGNILQRKGDYAGAADHLRRYLELEPGAADATQIRAQLAQTEQAANPAAPNPNTAK